MTTSQSYRRLLLSRLVLGGFSKEGANLRFRGTNLEWLVKIESRYQRFDFDVGIDWTTADGINDPNLAPLHALFDRIVETQRRRQPDLDRHLGTWRLVGVLDLKSGMEDNQSGWIGEGFDLTSGYIERTYTPCQTDTGVGANNSRGLSDFRCFWVGLIERNRP